MASTPDTSRILKPGARTAFDVLLLVGFLVMIGRDVARSTVSDAQAAQPAAMSRDATQLREEMQRLRDSMDRLNERLSRVEGALGAQPARYGAPR